MRLPSAREWGVEWYNAYVAREKLNANALTTPPAGGAFGASDLGACSLCSLVHRIPYEAYPPQSRAQRLACRVVKTLPESQWAKPSAALNELSEQLRAAYQRGEKFIEMGDIENRFGMVVPAARQQAYPTFPFRRGSSR